MIKLKGNNAYFLPKESNIKQIEDHVKAEHKEIELTPENVANIKTLIKDI